MNSHNHNNHHTQTSVLSGERLLSFLNDTRDWLDRGAEDQTAPELRRATLVARLERQPMQVDSIEMLDFLVALYTTVEAWDSMLASLDAQVPALLALLDEAERADAALRSDLMRADALFRSGNRGACREVLHAVEQLLLRQGPVNRQNCAIWDELELAAGAVNDQPLVRRCLQVLHDFAVDDPQNTFNADWHRARLALNLGMSWHLEGKAEPAQQCAADALAAMALAGPKEELDYSDWLDLGDQMVAFAPRRIVDVCSQVRAALGADIAQGTLRCVEVQLARLCARAAWNQGQQEEALRIAPLGHYELTDDGDDRYGALWLDWLVQAGRWDDAGALAFDCARQERPESHARALDLAVEQVKNTQRPNVYWHLILADAMIDGKQSWLCDRRNPDEFFRHHMAQARLLVPDHPGIDWLQGLYLRKKRQYANALTHLERATLHPHYATGDAMIKLWECRIRVHGFAQAMAMPFVPAGSACWNYATGCDLQPDEMDLPKDVLADEDACKAALESLQCRYYEAGLEQFQRFFAGAQGRFDDANLHTFSKLCNNLAIFRYLTPNRVGEAIALHKAGIAVRPFAEHYDGLVRCMLKMGDLAGHVEAGERLWHFAMEYGYSRYGAAAGIYNIISSLEQLDRAMEVSVWLERLHQWWAPRAGDQFGEDGDNEDYINYLNTMAWGLRVIAVAQPEDALLRLQPLLPELLAHNKCSIWYHTTIALYCTRQYKECIAWGQACLSCNEMSDKERSDLEQYTWRSADALGLSPSSAHGTDVLHKWWQFWK